MTTREQFAAFLQSGIPVTLPASRPLDPALNHAPKRQLTLSAAERTLAVQNALRYFPPALHAELTPEFTHELEQYGHIYMYRFRPPFTLAARHIDDYPARSKQAAAIMLMICNNLDPAVLDGGFEDQAWKDLSRLQYYLLYLENQQLKLMAIRAMAQAADTDDPDVVKYVENSGLPAD